MAELTTARYIARLMKPHRRHITPSPFIPEKYPKVKDKDKAIHELREELEVGLNRCQYAIAELVEALDELKK
ncbi:MAG TPA: hypothetical protein ENI27_07470 [bacterium]|nr:hypothetical protein [bacterium]